MHWKVKAQRSSRQIHYWGAIIAAIPVVIILGSGLLLQVKKEFEWIQPPTQKGAEAKLSLQFDEILQIAKQDTNTKVESWDDINRLDVRPSKGLVKVRTRSDWEIQIDTSNGEILQSRYRRSDWIESIHDGSFFMITLGCGSFSQRVSSCLSYGLVAV